MDKNLSSKRYGDPFLHFEGNNSSHIIILELAGINKKILEIGTSIGNVSKLLKERGNRVTGIEIDPEAATIAKAHCDHMIVGDVETVDLDKDLEPASFDVIVCGDVLEHLKNPSALLKRVKKYLKPDGFLVISLPNFCHGDVILNLFYGDFKYTSMGLLDETHLRFFGLKNIIKLLSECGYQISDIHTTKFEIGNTELKLQDQKIHPDLLKFISSLPNSTIYQYIFIARPSENIKNPSIEKIDINKLFTDSLDVSTQEIEIPLLQIISDKESLLNKTTEQIQALETILTEKDQQITDVNARIRSLERDVQALETILTEKDQQITDVNARIRSLELKLASIEHSIIWQFTMKFHNKIIERIFPFNTSRRRYYDLGRSGGKILINEGYYAFCQSVRRFSRDHKKLKDYQKLIKQKDSVPTDLGPVSLDGQFFSHRPTISIIIPVWNTEETFLPVTINSVINQTYDNWELCIVDGGSTKQYIRTILNEYVKNDSRIKVKFLTENRGISENTNEAVSLATGEFIGFLDHDDELAPSALYEVVKLLNQSADADVIYSDEDKITRNGVFCEPFYKPDWSPEFFRGVMYVGHFLIVRTSLAKKIGLFDRSFDFVQDYEFMLRLSENTRKIYHIPKILYHWRKTSGSIAMSMDSKGDISEKQVGAVNAHLKRLGLPASAHRGPLPHRAIIRPILQSDYPLVSIIIPTKDKPELIGRCLKSIFEFTTYPHFEVIVVDNNTTDQAAKKIIDEYPCEKLPYPEEFNFSKVNNLGAKSAKGNFLIFLNNDTQINSGDWIQNLLYYAEQADVAAVGPLLIFPNNTVQHAGVVLGFRGTADHIMREFPIDGDGYAGSLSCAREVSAVTAACMMVKKHLFWEVGGFNEHYSIVYQDVDLCLKFLSGGYRIIFNPHVVITHFESSTRDKHQYDLIDRNLLLDQWSEIIENGDKYYNENFDLTKYGQGNTGYSLKEKEVR